MSDTPASPQKTSRWRKWGRRTLIALASLLLLGLLVHLVENWRGARALTRAKADWKAAGLPSAAELFKDDAPVAPEKNLLDAPFFSEWKKTQNGTRDPRYIKWDALSSLGVASGGKDSGFPGLSLASFFNKEKASTKLTLTRIEGKSDGELVVAAIEADFPEFKQLAETVASRPETNLGTKYPPLEKLFEQSPVVSFRSVRTGSLILAAYSLAKLETGDASTAHAAILAGLRGHKVTAQQPLLVNAMIANVTISVFPIPATREGLIRHAWTEPQLAELENKFSGISPTGSIRRALHGEAHAAAAMMDKLDTRILGQFLAGKIGAILFKLMPSGWIDLSIAKELDIMRELSAKPTGSASMNLPPHSQQLNEVMENPYSPSNILPSLAVPAVKKVTANAARCETRIHCVRIGIAAERHRLAKGAFPTKLEDLVPAYLPAIPAGPVTGQPPVYTPDNQGGYTLTYAGDDFSDTPDAQTGKDIVWTMPARS